MSWFPVVSFCPDQLSILPFVWGGALLSEVFSQIHFFSGGALSTFIHLSLGKAGSFTLENHIHVKALKMQGFPNN